ncbi:MAG: ATP-binding cassette domain-containing protein, partial [Proteobacteria bacterium]|nr:ATP-binding cassette domain-containing protein [Pseudomonadota bacterium]
MEPLISIRNITKHFDISGGLLDQYKWNNGSITREKTIVQAVNGVSFDILPGDTLSVVGESGCGKSTLGRAVVGIHKPTAGEVHYRGARIDNLSASDMIPYRRKMQMVFQDPYASLNPRMTVRQTL